MAKDFEKLLRMVADYHNFCSDQHLQSAEKDDGELSMEELDFVAAAAAVPVREEEEKH